MKITHVIESVDSKVAPVSAPLHAQSTKTQLKQHVYSAPEKKTPAVVNHIKSKDVKEGMAQDEAEEYSGWRAEFVNQINYNTFEVKMTNTRSKESANFVVRPVDMISHGPTLAIETMDVHDLQTGQTASWTSDDPQPDGGIVYAISGMFYDNKELQRKLWTIVDTHNTKGQDKMPGLDQRRSIGQEVDADAYIDSQEKTQAAMAKMKKGMTEAEKTAKIFHPQYVDVYFLDGPRRTPLLVNRKVPYNLIDRYLEVAIKKYNLQQGRFEFRNAEEDPVKVTESVDYLEEK